jgi:transposase-like protein
MAQASRSSSSSSRSRRSTSSATSDGNKRRKAARSGSSSKRSSSSSSRGRLGTITNLPQLIDQFGSEDKCHEYLAALRWPDGVRCPRCEAEGEDASKVGNIYDRHQYECSRCRYQFSVRVGTIFEDSKLPLWKWFLTTYLMVVSKKGVSANQIKEMVGVSYKTSWYLCHRIRAAMRAEQPKLLTGTVEVDETFIGGKRRGQGRGPYAGEKDRPIVAAAVARGGDVRLRVIKSRDGKALGDFISTHVADEAPNVYTDEWQAYKRAGIADADTRHGRVNHSAGEYVRGDVHTNTAESVWSLFKRSIIGSYHQLSVKHLPAYLDEMSFRFNNRKNPYLFRDTLKELVTADRLRYRQLVAPERP